MCDGRNREIVRTLYMYKIITVLSNYTVRKNDHTHLSEEVDNGERMVVSEYFQIVELLHNVRCHGSTAAGEPSLETTTQFHETQIAGDEKVLGGRDVVSGENVSRHTPHNLWGRIIKLFAYKLRVSCIPYSRLFRGYKISRKTF